MKTISPSRTAKRTANEPADDAVIEPAHDSAGERADGDDKAPTEYGGPRGKEPTRYGDWERNGRCIDF